MQTALCTDELDVLCIILQAGNVDMKEFIVKIFDQSTQVKKLDRKEVGTELFCPASRSGKVPIPSGPFASASIKRSSKRIPRFLVLY
jgi:hypothetical protein